MKKLFLILSIAFSSNGYAFLTPTGGGGGGGGGGGNVSGPSTSTRYGAPVFGGTDGTALLDSVLSGNGVLVTASDGQDAGSGTNNITGNLSLGFSGIYSSTGNAMYGPGMTGWKMVPYGGYDYLEMYVQGKSITQINGFTGYTASNSSTPKITYAQSMVIRPDTQAHEVNFGGAANAFNNGFFHMLSLGGNSSDSGGNVRSILIYDNTQSSGGASTSGPGIGFDASTASEWYFTSYDKTINHIRESFGVNLDTGVTKAGPPPDTFSDAVKATSMRLAGANKTNASSTGDGGDTIIDVGTSVGGAAGKIKLPSITASKVLKTDASNNLVGSTIGVSDVSATGTASSTTFLRGDGAWATPASTGVSGSWATTDSLLITGGTNTASDSTIHIESSTNSLGILTNYSGAQLLAGSAIIISDRLLNSGTGNTYVGRAGGNSMSGSNNSIFGSNAIFNSAGGLTGSNNTGMGYGSLINITSGSYNISIGGNALSAGQKTTTGSGNIVLGYDATTETATTSNVGIIGDYGSGGYGYLTDIYLGYGMSTASANLAAFTLHTANAAIGTDQSASASVLNIVAGAGTGTGAGADVNLQFSAPGSTGTTRNSAATALNVNGSTGAVSIEKALTLSAESSGDTAATIGLVTYHGVTAIAAPRILTLPAVSATPGSATQLFILTVKDESGSASVTNTIVITRAGSDTIDGAASVTINAAYGVVRLGTRGSGKWFVL